MSTGRRPPRLPPRRRTTTKTASWTPGKTFLGSAPATACPRDPDDPGPPELKRGKPVEQERAKDRTPEPAASAKSQPSPRETASNVPLPSVNLPPAELPRSERSEDQVARQAPQQDALIQRASEAALEFTETLPNYVCQEMMSRSQSETQPANWRPLDVVTMEVVYDQGKENYRNIAVNGKATTKPLSEIGGAYSTGEFGTILVDLFSPATAE